MRTGVDTQYFAPLGRRAQRAADLVFTGSMDWLPNEDAMTHFCHDVLPLIREQEPRVRLSIVGRAPTPAVRALASDAIEVTGTVDDVRPYMDEGGGLCRPLRIGGGTRLKIFEAMAMGKAVVSTTVGAEGLPVTDGEHALIADEPRPLRTRSFACFATPAGARARARRSLARRRALRLVGRRRRARGRAALSRARGSSPTSVSGEPTRPKARHTDI